MAKKVKITKGGQTVYPATVMDAVVHPDLKVDSSKLIEEVNVSKIYPTGGIDGTNKYTLETAIAKIPASLRNVGIKCSFINEDNQLETWEWQGGTFSNTNSWLKHIQKGDLNRLEYKYIIAYFVSGNINNIFIHEKSYINNEGEVGNSSNNNWFTSSYIPISIAKEWTIHAGYANKSFPNMAFFDKSFNALGGYKYTADNDSYANLTVTDTLLQLYPTAEYVIYASYDYELSQVTVKNNITEIAARLSDCESGINELNISLDENTEKISEIEETMSSGLGTEIIGNLLTDITTESGYYLSGGNPASSANWSITSFIEVEPGTEYAYMKATGDYSHDYFYDKNQTPISAISYDATNEPVLLFTTPENCKYVRFSVNSPTPNFSLAYLCKTSSIQNWNLPKETVVKGNLRVNNI